VVAELNLIEENRGVVGSAPRMVLTALQAIARGVVLVVLLWSVRPVLALLPLLAFAPVLAEGRAARIRDHADAAVTDQRRLRDQLFETVLSGPPAAEIRVYRLADDLIARHARAAAQVTRGTTIAALQAAAVAVAGWAVFLVGFVVAVAITVRAAVAGGVSPGEVVLFVVLAQQARQVLGIITDATRGLLTSARTVERISEIERKMKTRPDGFVEP